MPLHLDILAPGSARSAFAFLCAVACGLVGEVPAQRTKLFCTSYQNELDIIMQLKRAREWYVVHALWLAFWRVIANY